MIDPLYVASGFAVGFLVGMTGVGGGSLMTPLLILLFGVHPATAVGTDLLFAASTKTVGTLVHATARSIDWVLVGLLSLGSIPATIATIVVLSRFDLKNDASQHFITLLLGTTLLATAAFLIAGRSIRKRYAANRLHARKAALLTIALGLVMGVLVTATSVGSGAIGVTVLLLLHPKMPPGRVVGSDIAHAVPLTLLAGAGHWYLGSVNWPLLMTLLIGSVPGIVAGSYLATRAPDAVIRIALASVLVIVGVRLLG
jgi:uncharacterized protein